MVCLSVTFVHCAQKAEEVIDIDILIPAADSQHHQNSCY